MTQHVTRSRNAAYYLLKRISWDRLLPPSLPSQTIQSQASEASTYEARDSQFSFSIFYLIVKDFIWYKKIKYWMSKTKGRGGADVER